MAHVIMPKDHPQAAVTIAAGGATAERGKPVEVDDAIADALVEQGWSLATDAGPTKDDLIALAADRGIEVKASWSKQKIADAIEAAPNPDASPDADTPKES